MSFEILFPFGLWVFEPDGFSTTVSWCGGVPVSLKLKMGAVRQSIVNSGTDRAEIRESVYVYDPRGGIKRSESSQSEPNVCTNICCRL